ncbi:GvpL/GvpF family gas vesicle protein [bacterium]|nr:GvpL/GvpF family gas vesicle protein [bacterium]MCG2677136.1 GvpL/GvpF family gas vesicle protein [bacterium]
MIDEGKYLYCIIESTEGRNFGPIGIGGRGDVVSTIGYQDLGAVISDTPMTKYVISRENMTAHTKVIEEVMKDYTVLPVRFCTIATSTEEVRNLLRIRYLEFKGLLRDMDNKIESGVKALWKDMDIIFKEIVDENKEIKKTKEKAAKSSTPSRSQRMAIGEMVKDALEKKKEREGEEIVDVLKRISVDFRTNKLMGDKMLLNAAFLVDRGRVREFDSLMDDLTAKYKERIKFKYVGPVPPYNFVNIVVHWTGKD